MTVQGQRALTWQGKTLSSHVSARLQRDVQGVFANGSLGGVGVLKSGAVSCIAVGSETLAPTSAAAGGFVPSACPSRC